MMINYWTADGPILIGKRYARYLSLRIRIHLRLVLRDYTLKVNISPHVNTKCIRLKTFP